jgi:hypothetical protein
VEKILFSFLALRVSHSDLSLLCPCRCFVR